MEFSRGDWIVYVKFGHCDPIFSVLVILGNFVSLSCVFYLYECLHVSNHAHAVLLRGDLATL